MEEENDVIEQVIKRWHRLVEQRDAAALPDLLCEDVVFYSPVVFRPQPGRDVTATYLRAAMEVLDPPSVERSFRYVREVLQGRHAVLEFETTIDGKVVNGVDMITCNDSGQITEFKVMVRPLQAINLVQQKMAAMLDSMGASYPGSR